MIDDMDDLIAEFEKAANLFARFRDRYPRGSDYHLVADDVVEHIYVSLDTVVAGLPKPQAGFT